MYDKNLVSNINSIKKRATLTSYKDKVLGKGINALLGSNFANNNTKDIPNSNDLTKQSVVVLKLKDVVAGRFQPRKFFSEESLAELTQSIKQKGVLQPVLVRVNNNPNSNLLYKYELIAGERRYRASKAAGLKEIPALIVDFNDKEALEVGLIENLQRDNLNPIEEAEAFAQLLKDFGYTHQTLGEILGKSRAYITNYVRLLCLPEKLKGYLISNKLSVGHAKLLVSCDKAEKLAEKIIKDRLTVRDLERLLGEVKVAEGEVSENNRVTKYGHHNQVSVSLKKFLQDYFNLNLKDKSSAKVDVMAKKDGTGFIKISFKDINKIYEILEKERR